MSTSSILSAPTSFIRTKLNIVLCVALSTAGCASTLVSENQKRVTDHNKALNALITPLPAKADTPQNIHDGKAPLEINPLPDIQQIAKERAWLRAKKVSYLPKNAVPANEVLKLFRQNGINITSALPLDNYFYNGNGVKEVDGETALQLILGQMGLDYEVDEKGQYVTVIPMKSRSWTINLGNRTSYSSNTSFESQCDLGAKQTSQGGQSGGGQMQGGPQFPGAQTVAPVSSGANNSESGSSSVRTQENFWESLNKELTQRMQILVPATTSTTGNTSAPGNSNPMVPNMSGGIYPGAAPMVANAGGSALYTTQTIGRFALNPETGSITIQAPTWLLKQIDPYMHDVLAMFNTSMTFEGTIVNVRSMSDKTAGFDLSALASYAGRFGVTMSNNILGGISLGSNNGIPTAGYAGAGTLPGSGAAFGITSARDNLQIFNAFLTTIGGTEIMNRPIVTVTSGVPVDFGRLSPIYTNEQSQTLSPGNLNSNAIAVIQNNIIEHRFGSLLRIMPRYDPKTRRVRAQISLLQRPLIGYQNLTLSLFDAKGGIQNQVIRKPQIECSVTSTEAILDDGELIIIGGQVENISDNSQSGVSGLMEVKPLEWFTSQRRDTGTRTTMYFALRVRLNNKPI